MKLIIGLLTLILILCLSLPAMAADANALPEGFIALAPNKMNWADAKAYCVSNGGRLPLINSKNSIPYQPNPGTPVDGFGSTGEKWPSSLPYSDKTDVYWTGTEISNNPGLPWVVVGRGGGHALVYVDYAQQGRHLPRGLCAV